MEREEIIEKLKPFWKEREKLFDKFLEDLAVVESNMSQKLGIICDNGDPMELEFFWADNYTVGVGAADPSDRPGFPLIHDSELEPENNDN